MVMHMNLQGMGCAGKSHTQEALHIATQENNVIVA